MNTQDPHNYQMASNVPPLPPTTPRHHAPGQQPQNKILRASDSTMRLERHELRRFTTKPLVPNTNLLDHHAQRLKHILDTQADVLDTLNAMTKIHIDRNTECIEILYNLYIDALSFSHRGKTLAPASHSTYKTYYLVFKNLEEIIHRQYAKAHRDHEKIKKLNCPYCEVPLDYYRSPGQLDNPPPRPRSRSSTKSPKRSSPNSPAYSPTSRTSSSSSSDDGIPNVPPGLPPHKDVEDLELLHLDINKILKSTDNALTRTLQLQNSD